MIGHSGYFGAGKTLNMTKELKFASDNGALIVTNYSTTFSNIVVKSQADIIRLFQEILVLRQQDKYIHDLFPELKKKYHKIWIGLDEAGIYFNAREFKEWVKYPDIMDFMLQCRKLNVEILYTVQHPTFVDVNFRRLTTEWIYWRKIPLLPLRNRVVYILSPDSPNYKDSDIIGQGLKWGGKSKVYDMYNTTELCLKEGKSKIKDFRILSNAVFPVEDGETARKQSFFSSLFSRKATTTVPPM